LADANEATVENRFLLPLLDRLGYAAEEIDPKVPIDVSIGRSKKGRKPEADYVVYIGSPHDKTTSLIVVEAKAGWETVNEASRHQAESYARVLLAPFCLLTNGKRLQVWQLQITQESICLFDLEVGDLDARFGELSLALSREAAVEYARALDGKRSLVEDASDWAVYLGAEQRRIGTAAIIDRALKGPQDETVSSDHLLRAAPRGAVVLASSGLGKSVLAQSLFRQALEHRTSDGTARLPVDAPLTELVDGKTLTAFALDRLAAHKPGLMIAGFQSILRRQGLTLICDGFDELPRSRQDDVEAEATALTRDYPAVQIFILSRMTSAPAVPLPAYELLPLDEMERHALIHLLDPSSGVGWFEPPAMIWKLCANPLLLRLTAEYRRAHDGAFPRSLDALFRGWLDQALRARPGRRLAVARLESALSALAEASVPHGLTVVEAERALTDQGLSADFLEELHKRELIDVSADRMTFGHQALADYLNARRIAGLSPENAIAAFSTLALDRDSLLPVLLMGALSSFELQEALWDRVAGLSLPSYLAVLKFRADLSDQLSGTDQETPSITVLRGLQKGIEQPLRSFFPQIQHSVREALVGRAVDELRIIGRANAHSGQLLYALGEHEEDQPLVQVGSPPEEWGFHLLNLGSFGRTIDSGRLIGAQELRRGILTAVSRRDLPGKTGWLMERAVGRLRLLTVDHRFDFKGLSLAEIAQALEPHRNFWAGCQGFGEFDIFQISEVQQDLHVLVEAGLSSLDSWSPVERRRQVPSRDLPVLLDEHFRRTQRLYAELVECGFYRIREELSFYSTLPVRRRVTLTPSLAFQGDKTWHMYSYWHPVSSWADAGADIVFEEAKWRPPFREDGERTLEALRSLGRYKPGLQVSVTQGDLPDFTGQRPFTGRYDGETSALRAACDLLAGDIKRLFREVPDK